MAAITKSNRLYKYYKISAYEYQDAHKRSGGGLELQPIVTFVSLPLDDNNLFLSVFGLST